MTETRGTRRGRRVGYIVAGVVAAIVIVVLALIFGRGPGDTVTSTPGPSSSSAASQAAPSESTPPTSVSETPDTPTEAVVPLDGTATPVDGITVRIPSITAAQASADQPGQSSGPAIRVEVELTNGTSSAFSTDSVVVNADFGADATPAGDAGGEGIEPFSGDLESGTTATATYLFTIPEDQRDDVRISVFTSSGQPVAVFAGAVPRS